ncbi:hypothetical protein D3C80_2141210 [compost metagenome]
MKDKNNNKITFIELIKYTNSFIIKCAPYTTQNWIDIIRDIFEQLKIFFYWLLYPIEFIIIFIAGIINIKNGNMYKKR